MSPHKTPPAATPSIKGKRRRRFVRSEEFRSEYSRAGRFEVRRRDKEMILAIAKHRYLSTMHVERLFVCTCPLVKKMGIRNGQPAEIEVKEHRPNCACTCGLGSRKGVHANECPALFKDRSHLQSRLRELFQAGYLERPRAQLQMRMEDGIGFGSAPMIYGVTSEGLKLLGAEGVVELEGYGKLSYLRKADDSTRQYLEHTLLTADLSIGIDRSLRNFKTLERLSQGQLKSGMNEKRKDKQHPFALTVSYIPPGGHEKVRLSAVSDLAFALGDRTVGKRWNFFAELDRGTEPVSRKKGRFERTSLESKFIAYAKCFESKVHQTELGWKGFRVLVLTTSKQRIATCVETCRRRFGQNTNLARIFLFGVLDDAHDPLSATFVDGRGHPSKLLGDITLEH